MGLDQYAFATMGSYCPKCGASEHLSPCPADKGPYSLRAVFADGRTQIVETGHAPMDVRSAESRVSRNPRVIARIELHDLTGRLETIWAASWEKMGGISP
jgi:hypothetical protein